MKPALDGSTRAVDFRDAFAKHSRFVWRVLARLGVEGRDVPDACQEVFLVVHRRLDEFEPERANLRSWIYGICARVASAYRRRNPGRRDAPDSVLANLAVPGSQENEVAERRAWRKLSRVLENMDEVKRETFVLFELEALPMTEIATLLDCPLQTAYSRLHAARRIVLEAFQDDPP